MKFQDRKANYFGRIKENGSSRNSGWCLECLYGCWLGLISEAAQQAGRLQSLNLPSFLELKGKNKLIVRASEMNFSASIMCTVSRINLNCQYLKGLEV